jgi:hypothetical protein
MKRVHLFEFMDLNWLPASLRATLREILECGNARPFRPYYDWVADEVLRTAREKGCRAIVELGAGTAPVSRHMARDPQSEGLKLIVSDGNPDSASYKALEEEFPTKVFPCYEPVDFSVPRKWPSGTLLFLSATLHHIPDSARPRVLQSLTDSAECVMVFEPLRNTLPSLLFVFLSTVPAVLLPLWFFRRPGKLKRFLWCWLVPVAPLMFWWDGIVSCFREWRGQKWRDELEKSGHPARAAQIREWLLCQMVVW